LKSGKRKKCYGLGPNQQNHKPEGMIGLESKDEDCLGGGLPGISVHPIALARY